MNTAKSNGTYSALQFTVSQYGAFDLVSELKTQTGFNEDQLIEAMGGDVELHKAEQKWKEYFDGR